MSANVMVEDRPTEMVSVDWNDEYRIEVHQMRPVEDYSIVQAEQFAEWLLRAAQEARVALEEHLAGNRVRTAVSGPQSGGEPVL